MPQNLASTQTAGIFEGAPLPTGDRSLAFALLADVFLTPPTCEVVGDYRRGVRADWLALLEEDTDLGPGIGAITAALAAEYDDAAMSSRLGIAFGGLFDGIGGPHTVAPYESAYCGTGHLFQAPVSEMKQLIAETGLSIDSGFAEPADHLSIELTLAAHLLFTGSPQADQMLWRLRNWVPAFCSSCIAGDATGFFAGAARALDGLIAAECRKLTTHSTHQAEEGSIK